MLEDEDDAGEVIGAGEGVEVAIVDVLGVEDVTYVSVGLCDRDDDGEVLGFIEGGGV